jgi:hypothetical protein
MGVMGIVFLLVVLIHCADCKSDYRNTPEEVEVEHEIHEAFKAAFSNRSDEVQDFFNKTFGQGGNASEVAERFQEAWGTTSEEVKRFVNETYWNISRIMSGNDSTPKTPSASVSYGELTEKINNYRLQVKASPDSVSGGPGKVVHKPEAPHAGVLDTAWNYFKSVFGVNPKATPPPHQSKSIPNKVDPPSAGLEPSPVDHHGGLYVGLIAMVAALFVLLQSIFNRNNLVSKQVTHSKNSLSYKPKSQVPSGYVRIA